MVVLLGLILRTLSIFFWVLDIILSSTLKALISFSNISKCQINELRNL